MLRMTILLMIIPNPTTWSWPVLYDLQIRILRKSMSLFGFIMNLTQEVPEPPLTPSLGTEGMHYGKGQDFPDR